jgi:hypothetical protein
VIFGCCYTRDCYIIISAFSKVLPYCRHLARAQQAVPPLEVEAVTLLQGLKIKGAVVDPGSPYFEVYRLAVERYSSTKSVDIALPQFFTSMDSLSSDVREFFLVAHEPAGYKVNIVPRLQGKQIESSIGLLKSLVGLCVRSSNG